MTPEGEVKLLGKKWWKRRGGWHFAPVSRGMGTHGIPDQVGVVPITITQDMVGRKIGAFVALEAKRPGRRGEKNRGATGRQQDIINEINEAMGFAAVYDSEEDLAEMDYRLEVLYL